MSKPIDVDRRQRAYQLYARYRNISKVSKELGIPVATLHVWKKQEGWDDKLINLQEQLKGSLEIIERAKDNTVVQGEIAQLNVLQHLETLVNQILVDNTIRPAKWSDVIKTLEYVQKERRLLLGENTENVKNAIEIEAKDEKEMEKDTDEFARLLGYERKAKPAAPVEVKHGYQPTSAPVNPVPPQGGSGTVTLPPEPPTAVESEDGKESHLNGDSQS